jgi:hypothetical protein
MIYINNTDNKKRKRSFGSSFKNNKKQKITSDKFKKPQKTEEDLFKLVFGNNNDNDGSDSESESCDINYDCANPLCNHIKDDDYKMEKLPISIKNINDLIKLGMTYHCKNRTEYFGINLKLLCNLVSPLSELNNLVGMHKVKVDIVNQIIFFLQGLNQKDKCGVCADCSFGVLCTANLNEDMLHTVITGPPGVGKTELGKILGKVYKAMGVLKNGTFNIAKRSDLIGKYLGHTAMKTQAFIDKCNGGVMFIDEAYSLGSAEKRDSFSKECIDTLNQNLTEKKNFLCIIAGYKTELDECFFSFNPGLARRFTFKYNIDSYSAEELMKIFLLKINNEGWKYDSESKDKLNTFFKENIKKFPHFGGDVETFFLNCKIHHGKRVLFQDINTRKTLTFDDISNGFTTFITNRKGKHKSRMMMYNL